MNSKGIENKTKDLTAKPTQKNELVKNNLPDIGKKMVGNMIEQVNAFANLGGTQLSPIEKSYASSIVMAVFKQVEERKINWNDVDVKPLIEQIKVYSRLGLSIADSELYIDIRRNGKTGKQDINIKKQYQGVEKEMIKWSTKKIVRFKKDVICTGDDFEVETDWDTGLDRIVKHVKNNDVDRNKLENITGAYQIAYVDEKGDGKLTQYTVVIDKNRIERAMKASPTTDKPIWKADTQRMVLKTATWSLYNYVMKPFIDVPIELKDDWEKSNDVMNFDSIKEAEVVANEEIEKNANTGELIDIPEEDIDFNEETGEVKTTPTEEKTTEDNQKENNYGY